MLMHEWRQYRDRQIRKVIKEAREHEEAETEAAPDAVQPAEASPVESPPEATSAGAAETLAEPASETSAWAPTDGHDSSAASPSTAAQPAAGGPAPGALTGRESFKLEPEQPKDILNKLTAGNDDLRDRLQALRARQQVLPLGMEDAPPPSPKPRVVGESREELVQRLLDPVLSLEEAATLLEVCATTVRRYTNRGILPCHRTPGNQRRFHLSDIMEFMERRQTPGDR
jgi:excisionase family DNA binding protein